MGFTKLISGITDSSIWFEHSDVLKVFITFWTKSSPSGVVLADKRALFRDSNLINPDGNPLPYEYFSKILEKLMSPDGSSKSKKEDGRRILQIDESEWFIVNYKEYREFTYSDSPEAIKKRKQREKKGTNGDTSQSVHGHSASVSSSSSSKYISKIEDPLWVSSSNAGFEEYVKQNKNSFLGLYDDWEFIEKMKGVLPNTLIRNSIQLSWESYWGTRIGWEKKIDAYKAARKRAVKNKQEDFSYEINWKTTLMNTLKFSRVPFYGNKIDDLEWQYINRMHEQQEEEEENDL